MGMEVMMGMGNHRGHGSHRRDGKSRWESEITVGMGNRGRRWEITVGTGNRGRGLGNHPENGKSGWESIPGTPSTAPAPAWAAGAPSPCTDPVLTSTNPAKTPNFPGPADFVPAWDEPSRGRIFLSHSQAGGGDQAWKKKRIIIKPHFPEGGEPPALTSTPGRRGRGQPEEGKGRSDPPGSRLSGGPGAVWAQRGCSSQHPEIRLNLLRFQPSL